MKAVLKTIFFLLGCCIIAIMAVASNAGWLEKSAKYIPGPYRYGDLYMLSTLHGYKIPTKITLQPPFSKVNKKVALTIIGDSYADKFDSTHFSAGIYRFIHWNNIPDTIAAPDKNKTNVIIIETTERYCRWRLVSDRLLSISRKAPEAKANKTELAAENNLQYMLTNLDIVYPLRELKTSLYLHCFDKFSPMVAKPDGSGRLYLSETVDEKNNASSFNPVNDAEIKSIVENMNRLSEQLKGQGFDEVYFSIIPNAASIYKSPERYNHLIERVENSPAAAFNFIDVYADFKQENNAVFLCNDSHWNALGRMIWLIKANRLLRDK